MLTHVGVEDHLDDQVAELAEVALLHVGENVAVVLLDQSGRKTIQRFFQDSFSEKCFRSKDRRIW